jgi:hypothetical protein
VGIFCVKGTQTEVTHGFSHCCLGNTNSTGSSSDASTRTALYRFQYAFLHLCSPSPLHLPQCLCGTAAVCPIIRYPQLNTRLSGTARSANGRRCSSTAARPLPSQRPDTDKMSAYSEFENTVIERIRCFLSYSNNTLLHVETN